MLSWAIINVVLSVTLFALIKAPLVRAYLILNYILIVNPAFMWAIFGIAHPKFIPGHVSYEIALAFMAAFNFVLCVSFSVVAQMAPSAMALQRLVSGRRFDTPSNLPAVVLIAVALAILGFAFKSALDAVGALRMSSGLMVESSPVLQAMKVFGSFDLLALIFLGELRQVAGKRDKLITITLVALAMVSLGWALYTGSRAQTATVLILMMLAYRDVMRSRAIVIVPALITVLPLVFMLFPLLANYRGNDYNFTEAVYVLEETGVTAQEIAADVVVTRLNYLEPLARVVDYVGVHGPGGGAVYWNNIIGAVPRLVWPDKPQITNHSRELGHQLGLVTLNDESTSIGLQVVGEAYFEFGWLGLWVAVFQALIFLTVHNNFFRPGHPAAMATYTFATLYLLQRDGYFAVVPGLIWLGIGCALFFIGFRVLFQSRRGANSYENLPYRFTH